MDSTTIEREIQKVSEITTQEQAQAQLSTGPLRMTYEAQWALQQAIEAGVDCQTLVPLAKAVGFAEGLVFALQTHAQGEAFRTVAQQWSQYSSPTGSQQR